MRMNKGAILASMVVIALASVLAGAGTMAYFSDTGKSTGNLFKAEDSFDIKLSNDDKSYTDDVSATWTFADMIPGDTLTAVLYIKNAGDAAIKALICDIDMVSFTNEEGKDLIDDFWMVGSKAGIVGYGWFDIIEHGLPKQRIIPFCASLNGDPTPGGDCILYWFKHFSYGDYVLDPGQVLVLEYTFEFRETGENQNYALGDGLTLKYTVEARSSPVE